MAQLHRLPSMQEAMGTHKLGVTAHIYIPSTWEGVAGGSVVQDHPQLQVRFGASLVS